MLPALIAHPQRQVILEPLDGHEYAPCAELALRYAAARHPERWPSVNAREPVVPVFQVANLQPARRATRYAAGPMTLTTAMRTLAAG